MHEAKEENLKRTAILSHVPVPLSEKRKAVSGTGADRLGHEKQTLTGAEEYMMFGEL